MTRAIILETLQIWHDGQKLAIFICYEMVSRLFTYEAMQHYRIDDEIVSCRHSNRLDHSSINFHLTISEFHRKLSHKLDLKSLFHTIATKRNNHTPDTIEHFYQRPCQNSDWSVIFSPSTFWLAFFLPLPHDSTFSLYNKNKLENPLLLQI